MAQTISVDKFFADCPVSAPGLRERVSAFVARQMEGSQLARPIVVVTSGGTTVPLEKNCVRFVDNFSAGSRGSLSAEEFLKAGYAVIFLNRAFSIQPFTKGLPAAQVFDLLTTTVEEDSNGAAAASAAASAAAEDSNPRLRPAGPSGGGAGGVTGVAAQLKFKPEASAMLHDAVKHMREYNASTTLLRVSFTTLFEYLKFLQVIAQALQGCGERAMFYLAAAVSDFYVPWSQLSEHKIQSNDGPLQLTMQKVPKMMTTLRQRWAPKAFVVSFKLETDAGLLLEKAHGAIEKYGVHAVVANLLHSRREYVQVVRSTGNSVLDIHRDPAEPFIERQLVELLVREHQLYMSLAQLGL